MIRLSRSSAPEWLDSAKTARLTEKFKQTHKAVWNTKEIKDSLLRSSHGKCAYCECRLDRGSSYLEVEHFRCKKIYPDLVVEWNNLLPACKRCNGFKGDHDVEVEPIVNPYDDRPSEHLENSYYRFKSSTKMGDTTIDVLNLNDRQRLVEPRFYAGEYVCQCADDCLDAIGRAEKSRRTAAINRAYNSFKALLEECQPHAQYSVSSASVLKSYVELDKLVERMQALAVYDETLETCVAKIIS